MPPPEPPPGSAGPPDSDEPPRSVAPPMHEPAARPPGTCGCGGPRHDEAISREYSDRVFVGTRSADAGAMTRAWDCAQVDAAAVARDGPGECDHDVNLTGRSLRFALAMRGGVSLAVWIGGAVAELDFLRSLRVYSGAGGVAVALAWDGPHDPPPSALRRAYQYGCLLACNNFHRVEVDVFAGASAGGLNSVLAAVAQRAGRSVSGALETWRTAGGLYQLLRPEGASATASIMRGDDYFFLALLDRLRQFFSDGDPHPGLATTCVSVDLSATVLGALEQENSQIREGHAGFRFATGIPGADIPQDGAEADLRRLALAARTTSSFPGAFERATIWAFGAPTSDPDAPAPPPIPRDPTVLARGIDCSEAFLAHRETNAGPFGVVDGGVFDNIPIERAFRAVRMQPATHPVYRALVYLDPSPPPPLEAGEGQEDEAENIFAIAAKTAFAKTKENAREDREEMEGFVRARWSRQGRYDPLAVHSLSEYPWDEAKRAYARSRAASDKGLLEESLADPEVWQLEEREPRPLVWNLGENTDFRRDGLVKAWVGRMNLPALVNTFGPDAPAGVERVAGDPIAAREAALWMLECIQWLEMVHRITAEPRGYSQAALGELRGKLYTVAGTCDDLVRERIRAVGIAIWTDPGGGNPGARDELWWPENPAPSEVWARLGEVFTALRGVLSTWAERAGEPPWPQSAREFPRWWQEGPWKHLLDVPGGGVDAGAGHVAPLFCVIGSPDTREMPEFFGVDGTWRWLDLAEGGPLHEAVADLREVQREAALGGILRSDNGAEQAEKYAARVAERGEGPLPATARLAGTQLFNFGGFGSVAWRETDWWWGRIDAAARVSEYLRSRHDAARHLPAPERVAESVAEEYDEERPESAVPARTLLTARRGGLGALRGSYKVSVLHRALRLATRAVYKVTGIARVFGTLFVHLVLTPVLAFLPAAAQPPRLVAALGALLAGIVTARGIRGESAGAFATVNFVAFASIAAAGAAWVVWSMLRRWSHLEGIGESWRGGRDVRAMKHAVFVRVGAVLAAAVMVLVAGGWLLGRRADGLMAGTYAVSAGLVVLTALPLSRSVPPAPAARLRGRSRVFTGAAAVAAGAALLAPFLSPEAVASLTWWGAPAPVAVIALSLAVVGTILCWGVVGTPRAGPSPGEPGRPVPSTWGRETLSAMMALLLAVVCVVAGGAAVFGAALLVGWPGGPLAAASGSGVPGVAWLAGVLAWANALWVIPMLVRLESPAWSDDAVR